MPAAICKGRARPSGLRAVWRWHTPALVSVWSGRHCVACGSMRRAHAASPGKEGRMWKRRAIDASLSVLKP